MDAIVKWLSATIPRVKTPLSLAALMLVILYALISQVLKMQVFSGIDGQSTYRLLSRVLDIMLYLGMTCVILAGACYIVVAMLQRRDSARRRSAVELVDMFVDHPTERAKPSPPTGRTGTPR